uniref:Protein FAM200A n=1 Tax=Cacopsylla melanoneura TaxID=428564 RepID=A0A8D8RDQ0_9HEMI
MVLESIQESIIDIKYDAEKEAVYNSSGYEKFWPKVKDTCPDLWNRAKLLLLASPTTYLVEKGFSAVTYLKSKSRNKLDIIQKGDLRLFLTNIIPDIKHLCESHQA